MGVLWTRADEEVGLVYDEMPTITASKVDNREKSPFAVRGWHLIGAGTQLAGTLCFLERMPISYYFIGWILMFSVLAVSRFGYRAARVIYKENTIEGEIYLKEKQNDITVDTTGFIDISEIFEDLEIPNPQN